MWHENRKYDYVKAVATDTHYGADGSMQKRIILDQIVKESDFGRKKLYGY